MGRSNKNIDIEHNASGVNNIPDVDTANIVEKEAKV